MGCEVIITASGGGHTGYAVSLAQRLSGEVDLCFIIPEGDSWTYSKVSKYGSVYEVVKLRGPRDSWVKLITKAPKAFIQSLSKVKSGVKVFVSTGSNHSVPPAIISKLRGAYLINIESSVRFTRLSSSVKLLRRFADLTVLQWEEQRRLIPEGIVVGPLYEKPEYEIRNDGYILVTGGTYGHKKLFDAVLKAGIENVVLQTGRVDPEPYKRARPNWRVFKFDPNFGRWLAGADVVVTHLGKTVIDAALTYRKPTVIVPNPEWRLTAGYEDAEYLARKLNAVVVKEITPNNIVRAINEVRGREVPKYRDGAEELAKIIMEKLKS